MIFVTRRFRSRRGRSDAGALFRKLHAHEIIVVNKFVAIADEEVRGRFLDANADDRFVVLAQFADKRREIRVATDDDESVDVTLGVAKIERIDDHADVGGVFARLAHVRDLDQLEGSLVQPALERLVALKIAISFLDDDLALEQQTLKHLPDVERWKVRLKRAECDILQVEEHSHRGVGIMNAH